MSRKNSVMKRINVDLDNEIKKKQVELSILKNKPITYVDTCEEMAKLISGIRYDKNKKIKL